MRKVEKKTTPDDRTLELLHGPCPDGGDAHFSSLGIAAHIQDETFCGNSKARANHKCDATLDVVLHPYHGAFAMQKSSPTRSVRQVIIHSAMGSVLGTLLALALVVTNPHIFQLIASSRSPLTDLTIFVGFVSFVVGTGATISGCIFTAIELNALEAKQRIEPFKRRGGSGT